MAREEGEKGKYTDVSGLTAEPGTHIALVLKNLPGARRHSEELSVSPVSYILAKNKKTDAAIYLSREEVEIIQMFRSISPENRRLVAGFLSNHRLS